MNITTEPVEQYLNSLYRPQDDVLAELRERAEAENIPIILREAEGLLLQLLRLKRPKRILEIGTAIGYSAMLFARECAEARVVTLELSEKSAARARENIEAAGLSDLIWVVEGDARDSLKQLAAAFAAEEKESGCAPPPFDFVFIDAAKGHYQEFWEGIMPLAGDGCLIVSDNVLFKGMTASDQYIPERRQKTITNRMRSYLRFLTETDGIQTAVLPVGDGMAVSIIQKTEKTGR